MRRHAQELLNILDGGGRLPTEYPYPLQVWRFGADLILIAVAGEPVVDYALLREGGYEGGGAMVGARLPGPFAPSVEETILRKLHGLVRRARSDSTGASLAPTGGAEPKTPCGIPSAAGAMADVEREACRE